MGELLALRLERGATAADVRQRALRKVDELDAKIADLRRIREALGHLAGTCRGGRGPTGDCPLLEALGPIEVPIATR